MNEITVVKVLKTGIARVNPFIFEMPVAGPHITVYNALNGTFVENKTVFAGKVDEFVAFAVAAGLDEDDIREGFDDLQRYGFLIIADGVFTPTSQYCDKFLQ